MDKGRRGNECDFLVVIVNAQSNYSIHIIQESVFMKTDRDRDTGDLFGDKIKSYVNVKS